MDCDIFTNSVACVLVTLLEFVDCLLDFKLLCYCMWVCLIVVCFLLIVVFLWALIVCCFGFMLDFDVWGLDLGLWYIVCVCVMMGFISLGGLG